MWNEFLAPPGYVAQNYQSGVFLSPAYSASTSYALLEAFGMNYLEIFNQQLQLFPQYHQNQYVQLRHYIVDQLTAMFSAHPDDFIEGDLGEARESFMSLDQIL